MAGVSYAQLQTPHPLLQTRNDPRASVLSRLLALRSVPTPPDLVRSSLCRPHSPPSLGTVCSPTQANTSPPLDCYTLRCNRRVEQCLTPVQLRAIGYTTCISLCWQPHRRPWCSSNGTDPIPHPQLPHVLSHQPFCRPSQAPYQSDANRVERVNRIFTARYHQHPFTLYRIPAPAIAGLPESRTPTQLW